MFWDEHPPEVNTGWDDLEEYVDFKTFNYKIYNIWNVKQTIIDFESDLKDSEHSSSYVTELINHLETSFFSCKKLQNNSYRDCWEIGNLSIKSKIRENNNNNKSKMHKNIYWHLTSTLKLFCSNEKIYLPPLDSRISSVVKKDIIKKGEPFLKLHLLINCPASMLTKILV